MSDVHEVLCKARNMIDRQGLWCGDLTPGDTTCTWLALRHSGGSFRDSCAAAESLRQVIGQDSDASLSDLFEWNDRGTKDEVLTAFDKAIANTAPLPEDLVLEVPVEQTA